MVAKCCIKGCKSEQYPGCEMTFHGFPSDEKLKSKWIEATRVMGNVKYKRICPLHFKNEDFMTKSKVIRLKQNVIPTFCMPPFQRSNEDKQIYKSSNISCIKNNQDYEKFKGNGDSRIHSNISEDGNLHNSNDSLSLDVLSQLTQKNKVNGRIARCKCCLEGDTLKSMWREHCTNGLREVYGTMLSECFVLNWSKPENPVSNPDLICESCIGRLRDALSFKTEVLASEQLLSGQLETVDVDRLKQEHDDVDVNTQKDYLNDGDLEDNSGNYEDDDFCNDNECIEADRFKDDVEMDIENDEGVPIKSETYPKSNDALKASKKEESFSKRKITFAIKKRKQTARSVKAAATRFAAGNKFKLSRRTVSDALKNDKDLIAPMRKHQTKGEIAFDNLSDNLRKSIEAVQSKKRTQAMAASHYNVPRDLIADEITKVRKTNACKEDVKETKGNIKNAIVFVEIPKIISDEKEDPKTKVAEIKEELTGKKSGNKVKDKVLGNNIEKASENRLAEMKKQANNIAIILESTNATPIRRHGGIGYGCCFCNKEFPDAADLKQHTIKEHDIKTKRNYAKGKRPSAYLVKLDITGLNCNLCGNSIDTLEQLYDHLIEVHKKLLYRNAKNYIVPFKFEQDELRCLFCEFICNSFKGLLEHMSVHYRNHICEVCDAGFLTKNNLFNHAGRHKKGTFKCDYCPKVFDTSSKKAGHQRLVHSSTNGVNRCGYCGEMFGTYRRKEKHLITEHGVTLKKLKCKACDKTFETQTGLRIHIKRDHLIERRFKCSVCDKRCFTNVQLNQHTLKHTGVKKFQCTICLKAYGRKSTLREHMRIHENDRRFKCELCEMAFVQKCSWRGHMLSKHGQQV